METERAGRILTPKCPNATMCYWRWLLQMTIGDQFITEAAASACLHFASMRRLTIHDERQFEDDYCVQEVRVVELEQADEVGDEGDIHI